MKLGVLVCDHVQEQLQIKHGDYPFMFTQLLALADSNIEIRYFFAIDNELPIDLDVCDAYMATGSKYSVNDDHPWINALSDFMLKLFQAKKKFIGICFGHQLIAKALGGEVKTADNGWGIGAATYHVKSLQPWMMPTLDTFSLAVSHQEQITKLPKKGEVVAGNDFCPFAMILVDDLFLGLQAHPEFSKAYTLDLIHSRKHYFDEVTLIEGIVSLELELDHVNVIQWLRKFLN